MGSDVFRVRAVDDDLQGQLVLKVVGEYPSQQFFNLQQDGTVKLIKSLREDSLQNTQYKLIIQAYDSAVPSQVAEAELTITVENSAPVINPQSDVIQINEFQTPDQIYVINAVDADNDNLTYTFQNVDGVARNFFWVNPTDGSIRLMRSLTTISTNRFIVSSLFYYSISLDFLVVKLLSLILTYYSDMTVESESV